MAIQILSGDVVDQIAAGEVVERPAHMIKELIENSLDAQATQIHIEWSQGGRSVRILDNGSGMSLEDLKICLERHSTSKIVKSEDLWKLKSFGFRGEALASISSVSELTISSRLHSAESAWQMSASFGVKSEPVPVSSQAGTVIRIENLFQNVPARLKFLKSDAAESAQIKNMLKALAMAHPHVEIRAQENGKLVFFYSKTDSHLQRVEQVLEVKPLYENRSAREGVQAYAVFADPHTVSKTTKNIWLFAQNRWIQDRSLQVACLEAYRSLLMHGEYPTCVVWVTTEPDFIDVNIHPTKSQVKFQEASLAFRAVQASLRDGLEKAPWLHRKNNSIDEADFKPFVGLNNQNSQIQNQFINQDINKYQNSKEFKNQNNYQNQSFSGDHFDRTQFKKKTFEIPSTPLSSFHLQKEARTHLINQITPASHKDSNMDPQASDNHEKLGSWSALEVIGQAHLTYIVCQAKDKIVFVDQHAAHERVGYEKLMSAWKGGKIDVQEYLFPLAIDLSPEKIEALVKIKSDFEKLGVFFEELGPGTIGVKAAPIILKESIFGSIFESMANDLIDYGGSFRFEKAIGDLCATMACHSVVRAGQALSLEQMRTLLSEMDEFPLSSFCPHGRPVSVEYPIYRLEKDFGRIV